MNSRKVESATHKNRIAQLVSAALILFLLIFFSVGCKSRTQSSTPAPTQQPSATPPALRGDPQRTSVPSPVTRSAIDTIRSTGEVHIGILYNDYPFAYLAPNGDLHGFEADLIRMMAQKWEVKPDFIQVTRQTRLPSLISGKVDILIGSMPHRRELSQFVEFSDSIFQSGTYVLVTTDSGITSLQDLSGRTVSVVGKQALVDWDEYASHAGISSTPQYSETVDQAQAGFGQAGGAQVMIGQREDLLRANTVLPNVKILDQAISPQPYSLAVRRGDTPLRDLIDLTIQQIVKSGEFAQLYNANLYGSSPSGPTPMLGEITLSAKDFPSEVSSNKSVLTRIKRGDSLKVAGLGETESNSPFNGQVVVDGFNQAVVNELGRRWKVPIVPVGDTGTSDGVQLVRSGQADLAVGVRPDVAHFGQVTLSQPYYQRALRLIHMQGVTLRGIDDLQFKSTIVLDPKDIGQDLVAKNSQYARVSLAESPDDAFKSLTAGTTYALVGDEFTLMLMARADSRIDVIKTRYRITGYTIAIPLNDPDFENLVNFTLQDMKRDGTLDRFVTQYLSPYAPPDDPVVPMPLEIWPGDGTYLGVGQN